MSRRTTLVLQWVGWTWIVVFVTIGVLGAGVHVVDHLVPVGDRPAVARVLIDHFYGREFYGHWLEFRSHPVSRLTHMILGIVFVLMVPLQLVPRIRARHPRLHRVLGRIALACSVPLIVTGWIFAFRFTYTGFAEQVPTVTFSLIYVWLVAMAVRSIRNGDVGRHREWMIRAFAMMMGISGTRVWFYLFLKATDYPSTEFFASIFWLGMGVNLLIAEIWINVTRPTAAAAVAAAAPRCPTDNVGLAA